MGERTIDTILRLKNEGEYRAALKNCNAEMKNMKSQLDLTSSTFRTNANSMEALQRKGEVLGQMYTSQEKKVALLRGALEAAEQTRDEEKRTVSSLQEQYNAAKKALDAYGDEVDESNEGYKKAKAEVDRLTNELYKHQTAQASAEKSVNSYSIQLNKAKIELNNLSDQQDENNRLLEEAKRSTDGCAKSIDRYGNTAKKSAERTKETGAAVDALATALVASGLQQTVEKVAAALMECARAAESYELAIAKVYTLADENILSKEEMSAGIMEISQTYSKGAGEIADAAYQALSAGVDTANALDFVQQSTMLSVAGFTDAATSVDVLTTILNAYGLEASYTEAIASKLVKTQDLGKVTVDQLGKVLGRVIPTAAAYNVNIDNIATAYASMTASGINAENTTTYLSTMMDELADSGSAVAEVLQERTGQSFAELMASGHSLGDVLDILGASVDYDMTQFSGLWSSSTAGKAAIALLNTGADQFNATLIKMANSSGTVAANYAKLADTSDYASQRLTNSAENLKIAVGTQLNPVLNELKNAGAGILEAATDLISRNPALVSAISGVVVAVGLLTTGMTALMIVKSVKIAMDALHVTLLSSPYVLVATAVAGLVAAAAVYIAQMETTAEKVEALTESSRALGDTISSNEQAYADAATSAEAAYVAVDGYIERLEELEAQGEMTNEQQTQYQMILDQINSVIPELNASLDAQTGLVVGGTDALRAQAEQWRQNILLEASYTRYKDDIAALAAAEYELAKNQMMRDVAQTRLDATSTELTSAQTRLMNVTRALDNVTVENGESFEEYQARVADLMRTQAACQAEVEQLGAAYSAAQKDVDLYDKAIEVCNEAIDEQKVVADAATQAISDYEKQVADTSTTVQTEAAGMSRGVSGSMELLRDEYQAVAESAKKSIETQIGLFQKISVESELTFDDMINCLSSQKKAFNNYADNITLAVRRGVDEGLIQTLSDGSVESMGILQNIVNMTDEQIAELNAAYAGVHEGVDDYLATISRIPVEIDKHGDAIYAEGYKLGAMTGDGLVAGLRSKFPTYTAEVTSLAHAGFDAYRDYNKIHSPSRRWAELAQWDVAGITTTYRESKSKVAEQSAELANSGYAAAIRARQRSIASLSSVTAQPTASSSDSRLIPVLREILTAIKDGKVIAINGRQLVGGTLGQIDKQMGQQQILTERGAK